MNDGGCRVDHGSIALIGFVAARGDTLELLELAEEILDQVTPFVHLLIDLNRLFSLRALGDHDFGPALVQGVDDPIAVKRLIGQQGLEIDPLDQGRHANRVIAIPGEKLEANKIAQRIRQREDLRRPPALGLADGLILSPPLAPWP